MHYFLYASKDAFITNQPNLILKNTGLDEVIEVEKTIQPKSCNGGTGPVVSRTLIQFDLTDISASIASGDIQDPTFYLNLKCAQADEIPLGYSIFAFPMAMPWVMGTGYKFDGQLVPDGVSWKYADANTTMWWPSSSLTDCSGGGVWLTNPGVEQSGSISNIPSGSLVCEKSFEYETSDVKMDIGKVVHAWLSGSIPNYGLILIHGKENDDVSYGKLRFFAKETNTIYQPYVDIAWNDSTFSTASLSGTGSLNPLDINRAIVGFPRLSKAYRTGDTVRIDVAGRQKYPIKTFTNRLSDYNEPQYLPIDSFYSIRDAESEAIIMDFDEGTRLSCDGNGNFFMLDTAGLPQERYYKIEVRSEQNGCVNTFVSAMAFKISR